MGVLYYIRPISADPFGARRHTNTAQSERLSTLLLRRGDVDRAINRENTDREIDRVPRND